MMKKAWYCGLILVLVIAMLGGCGQSEQPVSETQEETTQLKMYLLGDKPAIYDEIYGQVNEMLKQDLNAQLEVEFIPWGEQDKKYALIFAANEDFDLVYAANWAYYTQQAAKNSFLELTDELLEKNNPTSLAEIPEVAWEQTKVNGKRYMIPISGVEFGTHVVGIRGDLREKYSLPPITDLASLEAYMDAVAENEDTITPWGGLSTRELALMMPQEWAYAGNVGEEMMIGFDIADDSAAVFSIVDTPEYEAYVQKMKSWFDKGYWNSDVLSTVGEGLSKGRFAVSSHNILTTSSYLNTLNAENPDWKVELCDISQGTKKLPLLYTNSGMAVHQTSKNPDKALQTIELLRNDPDYFNLTWYGVEGKHWEPVGDKEFRSLNDQLPSEEQYYPGCVWGWRNAKLWRTESNMYGDSKQMLKDWEARDMVQSDVQAFNFNSEQVKNEMAAVTNVYKQYGVPLEYGFVDPVEGLRVYREKLEQAGHDKILAEMQRQLDAYLNQ